MAPAAVVASSVNAPLGPVVERCTSKPLSLDELSCHETSIWLQETASAFVLDGGFTVGPPAVAASSSIPGASGLSASQATIDRMRLKHTKQMLRDTRIRPPEGAVLLVERRCV